MADLIDVMTALVDLVAGAIYANGTGQASITGRPAIIYPGWPDSTTLTSDLLAGKTHVTVYPLAAERNTTRYPQTPQVTVDPAPTITAAIAGQTVTIGGTVTVPQNVTLLINGQFFNYAVQPTDTLSSIASALAALVGATVSGTSSSGAVLTVASSGRIMAARVGAAGTVVTELRRQERLFGITIWAPNPADRDQVGAAADVALAATKFLTLPDGFAARVIYKGSPQTDAQEKEQIYRRNLNYSVEYATTTTSQVMAVTAPYINLGASEDPTNTTIATIDY